jgi:hypothetical protein
MEANLILIGLYLIGSVVFAHHIWPSVDYCEKSPNCQVKAMGSFIIVSIILFWPVLLLLFWFHLAMCHFEKTEN